MLVSIAHEQLAHFLSIAEKSRFDFFAQRPDLLTDARFADPAKQAANSAQLTAILLRLPLAVGLIRPAVEQRASEILLIFRGGAPA